jgi:ubiquinone/menaquinone biosynthesis C-methylase UbiE
MSQEELDRIRGEYQSRDTASTTPYRWDNPGYVTFMQSVERALLRALDEAGVALAGARVLDVGTGSGYFLQRFNDFGAGQCTGIDLMEDRVAAARERHPTLDLRVGSATELPFADGSFDLVTQFTCLSSILDGKARAAAAAEMRRVVADDGWVLSFDMRRSGRPAPGGTPTIGLDERALRELFGEPRVLRSVGPSFSVAQLAGRHYLLAQLIGFLPQLRAHLLGIWPGGPR